MKKVVASISVLIYFAMSCGIIVNLHYCMGHVQSVDFYGTEKKICDKCGMSLANAHGCCKEEIKILKLQNDQNRAQVFFSVKNIVSAVTIPSEFIVATVYNPCKSFQCNDQSPPLLKGQDTYLKNCVFRI